MENVTLVIRIDAGLINVNPETVEEALNKYFAPDGAVSVFYAAEQSVYPTGCPDCGSPYPSGEYEAHFIGCPRQRATSG